MVRALKGFCHIVNRPIRIFLIFKYTYSYEIDLYLQELEEIRNTICDFIQQGGKLYRTKIFMFSQSSTLLV